MCRVKEQMSVYQRECTGYVHTTQDTHKKSKHLCILSNNGPKGEADMSGNELIKNEEIQSKIYTIHDVQVMLDKDLAEFYGVKPIRLREQVKRNIKRFPSDFMFQLTEEEVDLMVSQNAIASKQHLGGSLPFVFTEQGVATISAVLTSERAIEVNIQIMRAFVAMRRFIASNAKVFQRLDAVEKRQIEHKAETDQKFEQIFNAIEKRSIKPKQLALDIKKFNEQYPAIEIKEFKNTHDRFINIDNTTVYHFGASLKDLGKKWFAFSKMDFGAVEMLIRLKEMKVDE